jgi:hypothetical protein
MTLTKSLLRAIASLVPRSWVGAVEYHVKSLALDTYGAFNGQFFRQLIFFDLNKACRFEAMVETGTFVGGTAEFLVENTQVPVHTVEMNPRYFAVAKRHLKPFPRVHPVLGNSVEFLKALPMAPETRVFFYLDAHWRSHLPLREETEFIFSRFRDFVIMIDDFAVSGDDGYRFDDYGEGNQLSLRDFPFHNDPRVSVYFPSRRSNEDSGTPCGCVVLASQSLTPIVDSLECLRRVHALELEAVS